MLYRFFPLVLIDQADYNLQPQLTLTKLSPIPPTLGFERTQHPPHYVVDERSFDWQESHLPG